MRKLFTLVLLCIAAYASFAQPVYYQFKKSTGTYTDLLFPNIILTGNWDDTLVQFKTPFTFRFFTTNVNDSIQVDDYGGVYFNNVNNGFFDAFGVDMISRGLNKSTISYQTEFTAPNRILKIQYRNVGFFADKPALTDSMNFQIWIYETSNIIEYRYGPGSVKTASYDGETGAYVDVADPLNVTANYVGLKGDPANPTVNTDGTMLTPLTGTPPNGTIYRFTPSQFRTGITPASHPSFCNVSGTVRVPEGISFTAIKVFSSNGALVAETTQRELSLSTLSQGVYLIQVETAEGTLTEKYIR